MAAAYLSAPKDASEKSIGQSTESGDDVMALLFSS
jgi:hypothetical protein